MCLCSHEIGNLWEITAEIRINLSLTWLIEFFFFKVNKEIIGSTCGFH